MGMALKGERFEGHQAAGMAWVLVFFAGITGLSRPFVQEAEAATELLLRQSARPEAVWLGKFTFNLILMGALEILIFPVYSVLMDVKILIPLHVLGVGALGAVCMAGSTTIVAAMVAKARSRATVFAVASLPVLLPALSLLIQASAPCFGAVDTQGSANAAIWATVSYCGILIVISWLLFPLVWEE